MGKLIVTTSRTMNTSRDKIWDALANQFLDISAWASGILSSKNDSTLIKKFSDAPSGGRICNIKGVGDFYEEIIKFNSEEFEIAWTAKSDKLPFFVSGLQNEFHISQSENGEVIVTSNLSANLSGLLGFVMRPLMKMNFSKTVKGFLNELALYVEKGEISKAKKKEQA
jgi:hypothetical protein